MQWIIDSFSFKYKNINYIVILKLYKKDEAKPSKYAKAMVEFIEKNNIENSILGYVDFYEVHFQSVGEFCDFFNINLRDGTRNLFIDFSEIFAKFMVLFFRK
jgi:hypothetical protein